MSDPYQGIESITVSEPLIKTQCMLGEGPLYDPRTNTLYFLDILKNLVYSYQYESKELTVHEYEEPVTALAIRADAPGLACAAKRGFALLHPPTSKNEKGRLEYLATLDTEQKPSFRLNDGSCDARGRFLAGNFSPETLTGGELWSYGVNGEGVRLVDDHDIAIPNGIGWTVDNKTMYFTNSLHGNILAYDYDIETGVASGRHVHIEIPKTQGVPDGFCFDDQEGLWSALCMGSKVVRFSKEGKPTFVVNLPGSLNITACAFGGPNNDKLFVTSASLKGIPTSKKSQEDYPQSGDLFEVDLSGRFRGGAWRHEFRG